MNIIKKRVLIVICFFVLGLYLASLPKTYFDPYYYHLCSIKKETAETSMRFHQTIDPEWRRVEKDSYVIRDRAHQYPRLRGEKEQEYLIKLFSKEIFYECMRDPELKTLLQKPLRRRNPPLL